MGNNRRGVCSLEGCEKFGPLVKTWCQMHYRRFRVHGDVNVSWPNVIKTCKIEGCGGDHCARGYCTRHYQAWHAHGDPLAKMPSKAERGLIPHGTPHGYRYYKCRCDICLAWQRPYARSKMLEKYGITSEDYERMWAEQGGRCLICASECGNKTGGRWLAVDHCHDSGKVRGLLCTACNMALGQMQDDPDRLMAAAAYLLQNTDVLGATA